MNITPMIKYTFIELGANYTRKESLLILKLIFLFLKKTCIPHLVPPPIIKKNINFIINIRNLKRLSIPHDNSLLEISQSTHQEKNKLHRPPFLLLAGYFPKQNQQSCLQGEREVQKKVNRGRE